MSKMTIEYVIWGVQSPIPFPDPTDGLINAMKYNHEMQLRREGVFGEITHRIGEYPARFDEETGHTIPAWRELVSGGKKMIKEIEETK